MKRTRKVLVVIGSVFAVLVVVAAIKLGPFAYAILNDPFNDEEFVRAAWLAAPFHRDQRRNPRGPMAEDLRARHLRIGMPKHDVRRLLGKPDNSEDDEAHNIDTYFLGNWGFMSIDGDRLIIRYDKAARLKSTEIYSH